MEIGLTPFKLAFGMEAITPLEYVVPSFYITVAEWLIPDDSLELMRCNTTNGLAN